MRSKFVISFILLLMCTAYASISNAAEKLNSADLQKILDASSKYTYIADGTTEITHNGKNHSVKIRTYNKKPDKSRIEYKSAPITGVVVYGSNESVKQCNPGKGKSIQAQTPLCMNAASKKDLFISNHIAYKTGNAKIANRNAFMVDLKSKAGKLQKRLWIDSYTYVTLRTDSYNGAGKLMSSTKFTNIKYVSSIPDSMFIDQTRKYNKECYMNFESVNSITDLSTKSGFKVLTPSYIPKGYKIEGYRLYHCERINGMKTAFIRYTNGISGISIFQNKCSNARHGMCMTNKSDMGNSASLSIKGINASAIGSLDTKELKKMLQSLR